MARSLACPQGHQWDIDQSQMRSGGVLLCPVCGLAGDSVSSAAARGPDQSYAGAFTNAPKELSLSEAETLAPGSGMDVDAVGDGETRSSTESSIRAPVTPPPSVPGYEIIKELGRGGMGVVYLARQVKLDRQVALKILPSEMSADPTFLERFNREARALAKLSHPNIVAVHDFGQADGQSYFVMEYIEGANLRQRLRAEQIKPDEARSIVMQLCDALQYAHEEGIIHRDIKPENVLLDKRGRVRIADFGIAKLLSRKTGGYTLTGPWQVVGTLHYMAPEQLDNPLSVDHRADIYSLGVVCYELLTGTLPLGRFALPSETANIDSRWDEIILRALEKQPEQRFQSANELKVALDDIAQPAPPHRARLEDKLQAEPRPASQTPIGILVLLTLSLIVWPVGVLLLICAVIYGLVMLSRPGGRSAVGQHFRTAETMIRAAGKWFLNTSRCAALVCVFGVIACLIAWLVLPPGLNTVINSNLLEIAAGGACLALVMLLLATSFLEPIPIWRPLAIMTAGIVVVLATGALLAALLSAPHGYSSPENFGGFLFNGAAAILGGSLLLLGALQVRSALMQRLARDEAKSETQMKPE